LILFGAKANGTP
jgi:dynein heavy chain, axonemal